MMRTRVEFEVYVTGADGRSAAAVRNLTALCESGFDGDYLIRVIDVLDDPDAAERQRIMATPMIVRRHPLPDRRVIGDLEDVTGLAEHLGLSPSSPTLGAGSAAAGDSTC